MGNCQTAPTIEWQNIIGGCEGDYLYSVRQTIDGGFILGGHSWSYMCGDKTESNWDTSNSTNDYWIVKINATGNIQWQNTIGGSDDDKLMSIEQTSDGGYILGGWSYSNISGDKSENNLDTVCNPCSYDYWIVKTDITGNVQWQNTIGGNHDDYLNSVHQTKDGGYILGGCSDSGISADKTESSISFDYWILKTDSAGNIQWQNTIGGSNVDLLISMQQTTDNGYLLGGYSYSDSSGDKTENGFGGCDFWIVKIDSAGIMQWQNTIGGIADDALRSIEQTTDGGYILGGWSESNISGNKTEDCLGFEDFWIVKADSIGNIQWQNTIGGSNSDVFASMQQTADMGYILGGSSYSDISGDKTEINHGNYDYWVIKTDSLGSIQWQKDIGCNDSDYLNYIQQTADGGYILGGFSFANGAGGDKLEYGMGHNDYWVLKLTDKFNSITGKCFIDINSNNIQDAGEPPVRNKKITEINSGRFAFLQQNGYYNVEILDSGTFSIAPPPINYFNAVPSTNNAIFTGIMQIDSLNDFAFQPTNVFNDLCVALTPLGFFRSGFNASYMITYENAGTTTLNPTVILIPDNDVSYISANPAPNFISTDSIFWNFGPLAPFQTGSILVTVNVKSGMPIGTFIQTSVRIDPIITDSNPQCNYDSSEVYTTGAFDPNDMIVSDDTLTIAQLAAFPWLDYIIRFQNTGNDTCFEAKILNLIDTNKLQLNTLEFVASSHPVNMNWLRWGSYMEFKFDSIFLPDSGVNEPASHGFVHYRIMPNNFLIAGDSITNIASIYFDLNNPILTNTVLTEIVITPTSYSSFSAIACNSFLSPSGKYLWTASGTYNDTIQNINGGDSVINIILIINTVDTSIVLNDPTLTSNAIGASYQWIDCSNGNAIAGAVNQSFSAPMNGNFAVIVTQNGCVDTSLCYSISTVDIFEYQVSHGFTVYPLPTDNLITVELDAIYPMISVSVSNLLGEELSCRNYANTNKLQFILEGAAGIYLITISAKNKLLARIRAMKQ